MALKKRTAFSLVLIALILALQLWYAVTSACPAGTVSKSECWGPRGVEFLGVNFNIGFLKAQLLPTLFVLIAALIAPFVAGKLYPKKSRSELVNLGVLLFSVLYAITSLFILFLQWSILY
ncbi:hypothetical protein HYS47_02920 [Candidatus Woesearchaeota archaeon]|nr:hypothetical protein [Candidatus Woesearchaeota archaeon]